MRSDSVDSLHTLSASYLKDREKLTDEQKACRLQKDFWEDFLACASVISAQTEDDLLYTIRYCKGEDLSELQGLLSAVVDERLDTRNSVLRTVEELQTQELRLKRKLEELDEDYEYQKRILKARTDKRQK